MSNTNARTRSERAANLRIDRYPWRAWFAKAATWESLGKLGIAVAVAIVIVLFVRAWEPPFAYRQGFVPQRSILARVPFQVVDEVKTEVLKSQAAREVYCVYENRNEAIVQLAGALRDSLQALHEVPDVTALTKPQLAQLDVLGVSDGEPMPQKIPHEAALEAIHKTLASSADWSKYTSAMREVLDPILETGTLKTLAHDLELGNQRYIRIIKPGIQNQHIDVEVQRVRLAELNNTLRASLLREFRNLFTNEEAKTLAQLVFNYLSLNLPETLTLNTDLSNKARQEAIAAVKPAMVSYDPNFGSIVPIGKMLGKKRSHC